jgi:transcriptional regulator with XRE-family HTH domain
VSKKQQVAEAVEKPVRISPADRERHRELRERFQREKPSLEQLVSSGEYNEPIPMGEHLSIRQAVFALREAREQAGLSLADVAERSGIDEAALSRIETGQHPNPTVSTLCRYAGALGKRWVWGLEDDREGAGAGPAPADVTDAVPAHEGADPLRQGDTMPEQFDCPKCAAHLTERQLHTTTFVREACPKCGEVIRQGDAFRYENTEAIIAEDVSAIDAWLAAERLVLQFDCAHLRERESLGEYRWRMTGGPLAGSPGNWHLEAFYQTRSPRTFALRVVATEPAYLADDVILPLAAVHRKHGLQPHGERANNVDLSGHTTTTTWGCFQLLGTGPLAPGLLRPVLDRLLAAMREALTVRDQR